MKLTQKQENFTLNLFQGMSQTESYIQAGYSTNMLPATIIHHACVLAKNGNVTARLSQLREKTESEKIMTVKERKERLSEISRARLTDYQESGMDGGWISIGPESPNTAALAEIVSTTKYDENGASPTLISRVKLHNPVTAIAELNKMEKVYTEGTTLNFQQNIKQEIGVKFVKFDSKEVAGAIAEAIRLGLNSGILGGNGHGEDASVLPTQADIQTAPVPESEN